MRTRAAEQLFEVLRDREAEAPGFKSLLAEGVLVDGAPVLPPELSGRDYATMLLHVAAEVEHALLVQYLFAAYSLGGPQVPDEKREEVRSWQAVLLGIAKEEMAHFITVQNVLRLIGAPLNLERDDFPWDIPFAPFAFTLEKLSPASLARYVYVEAPTTWPADAEPYREEITRLATEGQSQSVNQVGELYRLMIRTVSDPSIVPESAFRSATMPFQASWDEWGRGYREGARGAAAQGDKTPDLLIDKVYSRDSAIQALKDIAEQGEGPDLSGSAAEVSHFHRFLEVWKAFPRDGGWSPVRDLATNPATTPGLIGTTFIEDLQARSWGHLANLRYRMLLTFLAHSFRLSGSEGSSPAAEARGLMLHSSFGEMYNLRVLSSLLVGMPVDGQGPDLAGPPFELPYTMGLPPGEGDSWQVHIDLIDAALALVGALEPAASPEQLDYLATLAATDRRRRASISEIIAGCNPARSGGQA